MISRKCCKLSARVKAADVLKPITVPRECCKLSAIAGGSSRQRELLFELVNNYRKYL